MQTGESSVTLTFEYRRPLSSNVRSSLDDRDKIIHKLQSELTVICSLSCDGSNTGGSSAVIHSLRSAKAATDALHKDWAALVTSCAANAGRAPKTAQSYIGRTIIKHQLAAMG